MPCKNCYKHPVIQLTNNNIKLCKSCFIKYFERKFMKALAKYEMIKTGDKVGVAVSSGKDSFSLLHLLNKFREQKKDFSLTAISIDEGVQGYRRFKDLKTYCAKNKIELKIYYFKEEFGCTLDQMIKRLNKKSCTICGILRRNLLNKKARELRLDKLATGHNLDDEAQSILMNQFKGNIRRSAILGPVTGVVEHARFVRRIKPLYFLTERETEAYALLKELPIELCHCPHAASSFRNSVKKFLNDFEDKYPGTKHGIINSFLELRPILKKMYKDREIKTCKECGEPCSQEECMTCNTLKGLS